MDCCYFEQNDTFKDKETFPNASSPEMFDSDAENEPDDDNIVAGKNNTSLPIVSPRKPSQSEIIANSDNYLLSRINKFLSGVPPPPKHTICQNDCNDFLLRIQQNQHCFWIPCPFMEKKNEEKNATVTAAKQEKLDNTNKSDFYQSTKCTSRNLSNAFDECELQTESSDKELYLTNDNNCSNLRIEQDAFKRISDAKNIENLFNNSSVLSNSLLKNNTKMEGREEMLPSNLQEQSYFLYNSTTEKEAATLPWPESYYHKFHGIHYNRNKAVEEFENLTIKLCERYIGAETQSTCNVWFSKQAPGSAKKRRLLAKRENGQSPGKRLSHLARRRRMFSSANLQGLEPIDKKQLVLNIRKPISKKGKSPRGKSPRGKSPRGKSPRGKSPRGSAKKKVVRRLTLDEPSPQRSKLETSKRALFQSPPPEHAGPSMSTVTTNTNPQKIKRALFPTPTKKESEITENVKATTEETRKRKNEEELEGPRFKWAKSLSFDCPHELQNVSISSWDQERHSSANILSKSETTISQSRQELSDTHRKKLLWAVAEALRSKGIGMGHPRFKQYASSLARTVKKYMPDLENRNVPRKPGSTSDRMLKLAKHHVLFIIDTRPAN